MDLTGYWYVSMILLILLVIGMVIRFGVQVITFKSAQPQNFCCAELEQTQIGFIITWLSQVGFDMQVSMKNQARSTYSLQSSVILADALGTIADFLFWGLIVMCGYWFIFYKLQVKYLHDVPA